MPGWQITRCGSDWQVSIEALPPGVSLVTAEAVLFVGKAQSILLRWPRGGRARLVAAAPSAAVQRFAKTLRELQREPGLDQIKLEQAVCAVHGDVSSAHSRAGSRSCQLLNLAAKPQCDLLPTLSWAEMRQCVAALAAH